jgi:hypothetical protein
VCWLDPGATTGIATWNSQLRRVTTWQDTFTGTGLALERMARQYGHDLELGYESYVITPGSHVRHDGSALHMIGVITWLAFRHGACMLPSQSPSARRVGLKHLRPAGWYRPGVPHGMDAAAHLLTDGLRRGWLPEELTARIRRSLHGSSGTASG